MAHAETHGTGENTIQTGSKLLYGLSDRPPFKEALFVAVFGGAVMLMFGTVAVAGFNILREVKMDNRSFVILAISLAAGLGVTFIPEALHHFPPAVQSVLESGIATGSICSLVLDIIVPKPPEPLVAVHEIEE